MVALAERLTGKVDDATVERVRRDVVRYLGDSLRNYPTREEFNRDKNRHIDKKNGVVWEERMEDGNLMLVPVSAYTNENTKIGR